MPGETPLPPIPVSPAVQAALDADHLRLLEIGFYISAVLTALRFVWFLFMAIIFSIIGISAAASAHANPNFTSKDAPPAFFFLIMAFIFGAIIFLTLLFAALELYAGHCIKKRKHPVVIQIVAALYCLSIPWGTALGVFTFIVLNRPTVQPLFARARSVTA